MFDGAICLESVQNLPAFPSFPVEFSTLSISRWCVCVWLVDVEGSISIGRGEGGESRKQQERAKQERERWGGGRGGWHGWGQEERKMGIDFVVWNGNYEYHAEVVGFVN